VLHKIFARDYGMWYSIFMQTLSDTLANPIRASGVQTLPLRRATVERYLLAAG